MRKKLENILILPTQVKGHILKSKVIWGHVAREPKNVKLVSFEMQSDWNQTWI